MLLAALVRPRTGPRVRHARRACRGRERAPLGPALAAGLALVSCSGPDELPPARTADVQALAPAVRELVESHVAAAEREPGSADAHGTLGLVYEANALWDEARRSFENAARLDPESRTWPYHAAVAMRQAGDPDGGLAILREVVERFPDHAAAQHRLGSVLLETGDFDGAEAAFEATIRLAPGAPHGHLGLGRVLLERRDYGRAASVLEQAVARDPGDKLAHYSLGLAYRGLGRLEEAQAELEAGAGGRNRYLPDETQARLEQFLAGLAPLIDRAITEIERGRPAEAIRLLEEARAEQPASIELLNTLAVAYKHVGRVDDAEDLLLEAKVLNPASPQTLVNLAETLIAKGQFQGALAYADLAIAASPESGRAMFSRGRALMMLARFDEAYEALVAARRLDTRNAEVAYALGEACVRLHKNVEAREAFAEAARRMPTNLPAQVNWGRLALEQGQLEEAEAALRAAEKIAPEHPRVLDLKDGLSRAGR